MDADALTQAEALVAAGDPQRALALLRNQAVTCTRLGRTDEARLCMEKIVSLDPGDIGALAHLGNLHWQAGDLAAAMQCYARGLDRDPANAALWINHGNGLAALGQPAQAARNFEKALVLQPGQPAAQFGLASALTTLGHAARAVSLFEDLARREPAFPGLPLNHGLALARLGRCEEAIARYREAVGLNPADYRAWNNMGNALREQQRMDEAAACFRRALDVRPEHAVAHSNLLLTLNYTEAVQEPIYRESLRFDAVHAGPLCPKPIVFANPPDPDKVLNVGYVSADLRQHSVAYFLDPVLAAHDPGRTRTFCYSSVDAADGMTARLRAHAHAWRDVAALGDEELALQIRADGIDVLVDLGGHTGGNRLLAFARRAAPVQVNWLGYPNTTGLAQMDYRLTDAVADPPGAADRQHSETLWRLPGGFLCYSPGDAPLTPATPPGDRPFTFGSFNTLAKVGPPVVAAWSAILRQAPGSMLMLKSEGLADPHTRERFLGLFAGQGIDAARLVLVPWIAGHREHLEAYSRMDLALDTFPYNGTTTTCEALSMGVPVLTLRGERHAGRVGASLLSQAGLDEWIATDLADYIARAAAWATRGAEIRALRAGVRQRMHASSLTDATGFCRSLESAYRQMWGAWCQSRGFTAQAVGQDLEGRPTGGQ